MRRIWIVVALCLFSTAALALGPALARPQAAGRHVQHHPRHQRRRHARHHRPRRARHKRTAPSRTPAKARVTSLLVGDKSVESRADSHAAGVAQAFPFVASASATVSSATVLVDSGNAASTLTVALYTNTSSGPGSLLSTGSLSSPSSGVWNTLPMSSKSLTSGTRYWLAVLGRRHVWHVGWRHNEDANDQATDGGVSELLLRPL